MPSSERDVIGDVIDAYNAHDVDRLVSHYADDVEMTRSGLDAPLTGKDKVRERAKMFIRAFPDFRIEIEEEVTEGNRAAGVLRIRGTQENDLMLGPDLRLPASNRKAEYRTAIFATLNDEGKIEREIGIFNANDLMKQLQAGPERTAGTTTR